MHRKQPKIPVCAAITTIPKQSPRETISKFPRSSLPAPLQQSGDEVNTHHEPKYQEEQQLVKYYSSISVPSKLWLTAIVESITINTMARISSRISTLSTSPRELFLAHPQIIKRLIDNSGG